MGHLALSLNVELIHTYIICNFFNVCLRYHWDCTKGVMLSPTSNYQQRANSMQHAYHLAPKWLPTSTVSNRTSKTSKCSKNSTWRWNRCGSKKSKSQLFSVLAPKWWTQLLADVRTAETLTSSPRDSRPTCSIIQSPPGLCIPTGLPSPNSSNLRVCTSWH